MDSSMPRILAVEDDIHTLELLAAYLKKNGFETETAENGKEALEKIPVFKPDLVLTDVRMPKVSGKALIAQIKTMGERSPSAICFSGFDDLSQKQAYELGADAYFSKPADLDTLLAAIKHFIEKRRLALKAGENPSARSNSASATESMTLHHSLTNLTHEIRSPLLVLKMGIEELKEVEAYKLNPKVAKVLNRMEENTYRIDEILRDSLESHMPKDTLQSSDSEDAMLSTIIEDSIELCPALHMDQTVKVHFDKGEALFKIRCNPVQISQVLVNLIQNAYDEIKTLKEKWIRIEVSKNSTQVEIAVVDSGKGVPPEIRAKIMTPFFTTKPVGEGTGLGLSISQAIMEKHKGSLTLDETAPHTRFVASLPLFR